MRYLALTDPFDARGREKTKGGFGGIRAEPSKKMRGILWAAGFLGRYYPQLLLKVPEKIPETSVCAALQNPQWHT